MSETKQYNIKITKLPHAEIEIEAEIPWKELHEKRSAALKNLKENVEIKGFRKGLAPEHLIIAEIGEMKVLYEQAELALAEAYPRILEAEKLDTIGRPHISITKIAPENPLGIKIKTAVVPNVILPDYKKIAKEVNKAKEDTEVTDEDVEKTIEHIREQWAKSEKYEQALKKAEDDNTTVDPASITVTEEEYPLLTDEFVQKLGSFTTVDDFKVKLKENMVEEKKMKNQEKNRIAILEKILLDTETELPHIVIESELTKMLSQFEEEVKRAGFKLNEYLKQTGKSIDDLKKEWRVDAEKRAKTQLILNTIAEKENITPDKEKIEEEAQKIMKHYKDADPLRARIYVGTLLSNEKVMEFLEGLS